MQEKLMWEAPKVMFLVNEETEAGLSAGLTEGIHHGETHGSIS